MCEFPAAAATRHPLFQAYWTALFRVVEEELPPRLRLMIRAPLSAAQVMPAATLASVPLLFYRARVSGWCETVVKAGCSE